MPEVCPESFPSRISFRTSEGVDIETCSGGRAIGYTNTDEWLEYTVMVEEPGYYVYTATVSSGSTGSGFRLSISDSDGLTDISENISVPQTASNDWSKYTTVSGRTLVPLKGGLNIIRLTITGSNCNIDKIKFDKINVDSNIKVKLSVTPSPSTVGTETTIKAAVTPDTAGIANVKFYRNGTLIKTVTQAPFETTFTPSSVGDIKITAIATDSCDNQSDIVYSMLTVKEKRGPYSSVISIPGTLQAENYDKGGEGVAYHDSNTDNEGDASFRTGDGVDVVKGNGGNAIGYTNSGEWMEYSVEVKSDGLYKYTAHVSSGTTNSGFRIGLMANGKETTLANVSVPQTGSNNWDTYTQVSGSFNLSAGKQTIRLTITGSSCNIDKIVFTDITRVNYITEDDLNANGTRYNLGGQRVNEYRNNGITIMNGKKVLILDK